MQLTEDVDEPPVPASVNPGTIIIPDNHSTSSVLCYAVLGDTSRGTFCTDMTGGFPVTSLENMQAYVVAYAYGTNTTFAKPCPDFNYDIIITVFEEVFDELKTKGYTPAFNTTDNQVTPPIKEFS
jgi:hypothetical protein